MKRWVKILSGPISALIALGLGWHYWLFPQLSDWAREKVLSYSRAHLPFEITLHKLDYTIFTPTLKAFDIALVPTDPQFKSMNTINVQEVQVHIDPFLLLVGRLQVSLLQVHDLEISAAFDDLMNDARKKSEKVSGPTHFDPDDLFALLADVPVRRVLVDKITLRITSNKLRWVLTTSDSSIFVTRSSQAINAKLQLSDAVLINQNSAPLGFKLDLQSQLTSKNLRILPSRFSFGDSFISFEGILKDLKKWPDSPKAEMMTSVQVKLDNLEQVINAFIEPDLPFDIKGLLTAQAKLDMTSLEKLSGTLQVDTRAVSVSKFEIGDSHMEGKFEKAGVSLAKIDLRHPSGEATLKNTFISLSHGFNFDTDLDVQSLDLQKLFLSLDMKAIPVWVQAKGHLPCQGQLSPLLVKCKGDLAAKNLLVKSGMLKSDSTIVAVDEITAHGETQIDKQKISYQAELQIADEKGASDGEIEFAKGFQINYKTPALSFKNIKNLGELKFEGTNTIEGSTSGNSEHGIFQMKITSEKLKLEGYNLGTVSTLLSFKTGVLSLGDVIASTPDGPQGRTNFNGALDVDLREHHISGKFNLPKADIGDLTWMFENTLKMPWPIVGLGTADISFDGPLDFWKLSYRLRSQFTNGKIGTESYQGLVLNVNSSDGLAQIQKAEVTKSNSSLTVTGQMTPEKTLQLKMFGKNGHLEESEYVGMTVGQISGLVNATGTVTGPVTDPLMMIKGQVLDTIVDEQIFPDSDFEVELDKQHWGIRSSLFAHKVSCNIAFPFQPGKSPIIIEGSAQNWNFTQILSLIGASALQSEYFSDVTGSFGFRSDAGLWNKLTGRGKVDRFFLQRGGLNLSQTEPIFITADDGRFELGKIHLEGPQNQISVEGSDFTLNHLNIQVDAQLELRLMHVLVPFLEEVGGPVKMSARVSGDLFKPQVLGNAQLDQAYVKIKNFPHPFEKLNSDIIFSQNKILVQNIKGQLAGGTLNGEGQIEIADFKKIPTMIRVKADGLDLHVPEKVRSQGHADLVFSGDWFPFTLSGTYYVTSSFFQREFTDDNGQGLSAPRQSSYLPKTLKEAEFEPVILDLSILFDKNNFVKNSIIDGTVSGQLQVKGPPSSPILLGKIDVAKGTKLLFKDKTFELQSGAVTFNNPNEMNPDLYITAQSRIAEYDVNLIVQGPAKAPTPKLSSVPALSEPDILSLIALGVTSTQIDQNTTTANQQNQAAYEVGTAVISNLQPVRDLKSALGVDLQYSNLYDSSKNISYQRITISRPITQKVNVTYSRDVGFQTNEVKVRYLFNQNFSGVIGYEDKAQDATLYSNDQDVRSILGIDLEYKREFK